MKILKGYILREFFPPYLGSMAFFTMLLLMERVMSFVRLAARGYASVFDLLVLVFYSVPPTLAVTMPMSTLMGALISVSRLSNDNEITAMRASGIRLTSIFLSLYITGICIGGLSFFLTDRLVPVGNIKFRTLYQRLTIARPDVQIDVHSINQISSNFTLLVDRVDDKTGDLLNVTIFESQEGRYAKTITARKGWFLVEDETPSYMTLRLSKGTILEPGDGKGENFDSTVFGTLDLNIEMNDQQMKNIVKTPRDMSVSEIMTRMEDMEPRGRSYNVYMVELHKKIAIPFACLLFVFLGTPFAITRGRSGKGLGLGVGVLIIFFYYIFLLTLERMGKSGVINPALAVWLPNILFVAAGVYNLIRKARV
ncbi:MAG: LptF/LptG family permease [Spirochaetota bacterium]